MSISTFLEGDSETNKREAFLLVLAFIFLLFLGIARSLAVFVPFGTFQIDGPSLAHFLILPIWVGAVIMISRLLRERLPERDPYLFPIGALLTGWGMITIWRIDPFFGQRQLLWFALSMLALWLLIRQSNDLVWLQGFRYLWLSAGIFLIILTLIFGTNPSGGEPKLWLGCCGLYFQPSEPLRLLLVAFLASFIADRLAHVWLTPKPRLLPALVPLLILWSVSIGLLFVQRDLGTATLFVLLLTFLLYVATSRWQVLALGGTLTLIGILLAYLSIDTVSARFEAWLNPWLDPSGGSYQVVQSLISLASGGLFGRGLGNGSPGFVPAVHTDFIFAAVTEETGFMGALALLILFAVLISRGMKVALQSSNSFNRLLAAGISIAIGLQVILIVGGVIRLFPLTGITLPFVSYGGSSLLTSFVMFGFLLILSNQEKRIPETPSSLNHVHVGMLVAFFCASALVGWWTVVRATNLVERSDNLRRSVADRYSKRGTIYDSSDRPLSQTSGEIGSYTRQVGSEFYSPVVGYNSVLYGQAGIEESLDPTLRGEAGDTVQVLIANVLRGFPKEGLDIKLSIDAALQEWIAANMDVPGALIALDSVDGRILALVSSPSYDANKIDQNWSELIARDDAPLLNRATQSGYQPGMAISPFMLAWAFENGIASPTMPIEGAFRSVELDDLELDCSHPAPDFTTGVIGEALRYGCPGGFSTLAEIIDREFLIEMYQAFGFDRTVEIRLATAPPFDLELLEIGENIPRSVLGQGDLVITPIQMARAYAGLVENGRMPALHLVDSIRDGNGDWVLMEPLGNSASTIRSEVSQQLATLETAFDSGLHGYSFLASAGPGGGNVVWFLGRNSNHQVVVLAFEGSNLDEAEEIGTRALQLLME